ncbi:sperm flagellar protein 2-like [Periplaneta americana]|uniref:sperm flagellar protein 2-like n=1 Tax=Periplaneta americana TaxID=6978 RepID=UPI0037E8FCA3
MEMEAHGKRLSEDTSIKTQEAKDYISSLKKRCQKQVAHKAFKSQMQDMLLTDLWGKMLANDEMDFNNLVSRKLLKQSQYEKQMVSMLCNIRHKEKVIAENRLYIDSIELAEREKEVAAAVTRECNDMEKAKLDWETEKQRNLELHKRLYEEKLRLKYQKHYNLCSDIVNDLTDIGIAVAEFRNANNDILPPSVWNQWKALFLASQPIFEDKDISRDSISETKSIELASIEAVEKERQESMDESDLTDYLSLLGIWFLEDLCPELAGGDGNLYVLGYIVHRLLDLKYPPLPTPVIADLPPVSIATAVVGLNDGKIIPILRQLLHSHDVYVIELENVIDYCLQSYKQEANGNIKIDFNFNQSNEATAVETKSNLKGRTKKENKKKISSKSASETILTSDSVQKRDDTKPDLSNIDVATQTPNNILEDDGEEGNLTMRASLGKQAFEILGHGEQIDDALLVKMLVEYLKSLKDMKGWVIINYPISYAQAAFLEESLSGMKLPTAHEEVDSMDCIEEVEKRNLSRGENSEHITSFPLSRLVPNPIIYTVPEPPSTYLTAYISIKKNRRLVEGKDVKTKKKKGNENAKGEIRVRDQEDKSQQKIVVEQNEQDIKQDVEVSDENVSPLESFYIDQGVSYSFYYEVFDFPTIKQLARRIVGDVGIPETPSVELFGDIVEELAATLYSEGKRSKSSTSKRKVGSGKNVRSRNCIKDRKESGTDILDITGSKSLKEKKAIEEERKKSKGDKEASPDEELHYRDKATDSVGKKTGDKNGAEKGSSKTEATEDSNTGAGNKDKDVAQDFVPSHLPPKASVTVLADIDQETTEVDAPPSPVEKEPLKPGEEDWQYVDLDITEPMYMYLATLWENLECVYLEDFKKLFFMKRIHYNLILPYINFVTDNIRSFIQRPDKKQQILYRFQKNYNEIDEDMRQDNEIKSELHCRVSEVQNELWDICDQHKKEVEGERQKIIRENWFAEEMGVITNIFISAVQLEIDRCVDTLQMVHDYYQAMLGKRPSKKLIRNVMVPHLEMSEKISSARSSDSSIGSQRKRKSDQQKFVSGKRFKEVIAKMLIETQNNHVTGSPFHEVINNTIINVSKLIDQFFIDYQNVVAKEDDTLNPKLPVKGTINKDKKAKKQNQSPTEDDEEAKKMKIIKDASKQLFEEWSKAIRSETSRTHFRLKLIKERAFIELNDLQGRALNLFSTLREEISRRYEREIKSVNTLCVVLLNAIEEEIPIQQELVLDQDEFYIRPGVLLYPNLPEEPPPVIEERILDNEFRIGQLGKLMEIFTLIAPVGLIPQRALVYMLEDMIVCRAEEGERKYLPKLWYMLTTLEIPILVDKIFGDLIYVDWKDFLILCLNLPFPTMEEILIMRQQFRSLDKALTEIISHDDYHKIVMWYKKYLPDGPQERLRANLASELLFTLFQVKEDQTNYTALLLYFCKDEDSKKGFGKALALCTGRMVFVSSEEYNAYKLKMEEKRKHNGEAKSRAEELISTVLENAIEEVEDNIISEISSTNSDIKENSSSLTKDIKLRSESGKNVIEKETKTLFKNTAYITQHSSKKNNKNNGTTVKLSVNNSNSSTKNYVQSTDETNNNTSNSDSNDKTSLKQINEEVTEDTRTFDTVMQKISEKASNFSNHNKQQSCISVYEDVPYGEFDLDDTYMQRVSFDILFTVLVIRLQWYVKQPEFTQGGLSLVQELRKIFGDLANKENNTILVHQFIEHPFVEKLLSKVNTFKIIDMTKEINEIINKRYA